MKINENTPVSATYDQLLQENKALSEKTRHQENQITLLTAINDFGNEIANSCGGCKTSPKMYHQLISHISAARTLVLNIDLNTKTFISRIRDLIIKICNLVFDYFGSVKVENIIIPAVAAMGVVALTIAQSKGIVPQSSISYEFISQLVN